MKPLIGLVLIAVLLPVQAGDVGAGESVMVNTPGDGYLALRSEPSAQRGQRLLKIPHGTMLTLGRCVAVAGDDRRWCRTSYAGKTGWVFERYLRRDTASGDQAILGAVASACRPDWCTPSIEQVRGNYASVLFRCTRPNCENAIAFLQRSNGRWTLVDYGTGLSPEDLVDYGFPADVARALVD